MKNHFNILPGNSKIYYFPSNIPHYLHSLQKLESLTLHKFNKIYELFPNKNAVNANSTEILHNHKSSNAILKHQTSYFTNLNQAAHTFRKFYKFCTYFV